MSDLRLPLLAPHDERLQKCVYCPKLSRAACPVSNVEANETVTPWGKMSMAYFAARGDVAVDAVHAESAWACSACYACRERCEHTGSVATVLSDARAEYFAAGVAPPGAVELARSWSERAEQERQATRELAERTSTPLAGPGARNLLLLGCSYTLLPPELEADVAPAILRVAKRLVGEVALASGCCGLPLLHAGDRERFVEVARAMADQVGGAERIVVADPGCAQCLLTEYPRLGLAELPVQPLVDVIYAEMAALPAGKLGPRRLRYHDPCQLGRGLGRYEEPRAILARLTGETPGEMVRAREQAECSGAGGLLPLTRAGTSHRMALERIDEHREQGGGTLVTACGASLRRFRSSGEPAVDLVSLVDEALAGVAEP